MTGHLPKQQHADAIFGTLYARGRAIDAVKQV